MIEQLKVLAPSVYEGNKSRGFWEPGECENREEKTMLMITELSEAVESHRKHKRCTIVNTEEMWLNAHRDTVLEGGEKVEWKHWFEQFIKDTVEDEIADVTIRILDYVGGFNLKLITREYRKQSKGNFASDVLTLTKLCIKANEGYNEDEFSSHIDWGYVITAIIEFCKWYNIDLMQHIEWKLKYNSTRPYKHGKKY